MVHTSLALSKWSLGFASVPYLVVLGKYEPSYTRYAPSHCSTLQCVSFCWHYGMQIKRFIGECMNEWMNERTKNRTNNKVWVSHSDYPPKTAKRSKQIYYSAWFFFSCCWLLWGFMPALVIFQPYRDLEAGDNHSGIVAARPGIEPRTSWSASQELNHYTTATPGVFFFGILANRC